MARIDENLNLAFGSTLREIRQSAGYSQQNLAFECDLDRTYISLLERGKRQPTISTVFVLSKVLGVRASDFLKKVEFQLEEY